jgi:hypothetical protein
MYVIGETVGNNDSSAAIPEGSRPKSIKNSPIAEIAE